MDGPIRVQVGAQVVEGKFLHLERRDMEIEITAPFRGASRGLHFMIVPVADFSTRFADHFYVKDGRLSPRGKAEAERLLREIYEACRCAAREDPEGPGPPTAP
jgi:hypothetical protein